MGRDGKIGFRKQMRKERQNIKPPFWAEMILKFFFPDEGKFTTLGDLYESYIYIFEKEGKLKANYWYIGQVLRSVIPVFLNLIFWGIDMLQNYILLAWRNFKKYKTHSSINLIGLTFGIAASIIILLFTIDELNFDKFNTKYNRIARIITEEFQDNGASRFYPLTSGIAGKTLSENYPEVENHVSIINRNVFGRFVIRYGDFKHHEADYLLTEPSFFKVFDFETLKGNPDNLLTNPNEVVLTETSAKMFFGNDDPVGKVLRTNRYWGDLKVTGVMKDPPENSHIQFSMLISFSTLWSSDERRLGVLNNWDISAVNTYLLFKNKQGIEVLNLKLKSFVEAHKSKSFGIKKTIHLQPLPDIHFGSNNYELDLNYSPRNVATVYILGIIGFFIVLSACINYSNLSISRYFNRAKEIGMRKVVGATKRQLFGQILSESIFMTVISVLFAIGLVLLILPVFNSYLEKNLSLTSVSSLSLLSLLLSLTLLVGIISGSLPAFLLTKLKTVSLMKMKLNPGNSATVIKKSLVVFQFVISIIMIFATITIYKQIKFIKNKDLGFNKEQILTVDINSGDARSSFQAIKSEFLRSPDINKVSVTSRVPGDWKEIGEILVNNVGENENNNLRMFSICADKDFLNVFDIKLKDGNNFSGNPQTDSSNIIVNNAVLQSLNITAPIGKYIQISDRKKIYKYKIIGVTEDFNFQSLHQNINPIIITYINSPFESIDYFSVKLNIENTAETIKYMRSVHEKFDHETPFEYNFLDEKIAEFYKQDEKESTIINAASFISILIACLGLFGLSAYTAQQKIKEIGIRKVLGATVSEITVVFTKDFIKLVIIASLIALPVSFYLMIEWLNGFAYRVGIGVPEILFSVLSAFVFSSLTISYQAIKAANTNPVETIRNE